MATKRKIKIELNIKAETLKELREKTGHDAKR